MTLEQGDRPGDVRLVECPFCDADLDAIRGPSPTTHLETCDAFYEAWAHDARDRAAAHRSTDG